MNRRDKVELAVFGGLVLAGSLTRLLLTDLPNFAPVAAMALFAGYFFRSRRVALLVPVAVMGISDLFIGSYDWQMMALVYGALMLPGVRTQHAASLVLARRRCCSAACLGGTSCQQPGCLDLVFRDHQFRRLVVVRHLRTQRCWNDPLLCASDPILPLHSGR